MRKYQKINEMKDDAKMRKLIKFKNKNKLKKMLMLTN